jgi:hypothetical protein
MPDLWRVLDGFGIEDAEMLGYWRQDCPVRTDSPDVLVTVYRKKGKSLLAIASWAKEKISVRLQIDWKALGINPERAHLFALPIFLFQPPAKFSPSEPIPVEQGKGWLLVLEERRR